MRLIDVAAEIAATQRKSLPHARGAVGIVIAAALALAACGAAAHRQGPVQTSPSPVLRLSGRAPAHIAVIVMENEEYGDVIGTRATPFINALARRYALAESMYATTHPSLPNYMALTAGSTFGIDSDCSDCTTDRPGLAAQLAAAHVSWRAYMEGLPHPCYRGAQAGSYVIKHDPFMHYDDVLRSPAQCSRVVPIDRLAQQERSDTLPRFIWITPNLCHDMHDCDPTVGDAFLAGLVPPLLRSLGADGLLFVTWDEGDTDDGCCRRSAGGHIATIVAGPGALPGARMRAPADQYSILQAIEDLLRLPRLRGAACACTPSLAPLVRTRR